MKDHLVAVITAAMLAAVPWAAQAQTAKPPQSSGVPDVKAFDQHLAEAQVHMQRMQEQMERLRKTQDPLERQKLLHGLVVILQNAMGAMHGMWGPGMMGGQGMMHGPGMMGGPGMKGWGGMHGHYSRLTPEQMKQRQYMTEQYMGMQQMMMDHMMQRQQWMTPSPASAGK